MIGSAFSSSWPERATEAIRSLAATGKPFTAEDVTYLVGRPPKGNTVGPVMGAAHRAGIIRPVGTATATRAQRHMSRQGVWVGSLSTPAEK